MLAERRAHWAGLWLFALSAIGGCSLESLELSGRPCPCGPGWECVSQDDTRVCVETPPPVTPLCDRFPDAFVCDDFEGGIGDDWDFAIEAATSETRARSGVQALEVNMPAGENADGRVQTQRDFGATSLYVQTHVFIEESTLVDRAVLFHFGPSQLNVVATPEATIFSETSRSGLNSSPTVLEAGRWLCIRLELTAEDDRGRRDARLFVDGDAVLVVQSASEGRLDEFWLGPGYADETQGRGVHAFFDDVIVTAEPIMCDD